MKKSRNLLIIGSIAFDVIFTVTSDFRKSIPIQDGQIKQFNASYLAKDKQERFGGNGGNMAYWLGTLDTPCHLLSSFGKDFETQGYQHRLQSLDIEVRGPKGEYTAQAYMISDPQNQQFIVWQPNSWQQIETLDIADFYDKDTLSEVQYVLTSCLPPACAIKHHQQLKALNPDITILFDPGQNTPLYNPHTLDQCLHDVDILTGNETERLHFEQAYKTLGKPTPWHQGHKTLLETLGEDGCRLIQDGQEHLFEAVKAPQVIDVTGAGDAFRAGLLCELSQGKSLLDSLPLALQMGAKVVGMIGPQD